MKKILNHPKVQNMKEKLFLAEYCIHRKGSFKLAKKQRDAKALSLIKEFLKDVRHLKKYYRKAQIISVLIAI